MKKRHTEEQIIRILKEAETGIPVADLLREHNIPSAAKPQPSLKPASRSTLSSWANRSRMDTLKALMASSGMSV